MSRPRTARRWRRRRASRQGLHADERGLSESTQWALIAPAVLLTVMGIIQSGLWLHGRTVLGMAASAAAEAEAPYEASPGAGLAIARAITDRAGLVDVGLTSRRTNSWVEVRITGRVPVFFDLGQGGFSETRRVPLERLTRP